MLTWYTEGTEIHPDLCFAVPPDGRRFPSLRTVVQPVRIASGR